MHRLFVVALPLLVGACAYDEAPPPRANLAFEPTAVFASRFPFGMGCGEMNPTFSDFDTFVLQPVDDQARNDEVVGMSVVFTRRVTRNVPLQLTLGKPVMGVRPALKHSASSPDPSIGAGVLLSMKPQVKPKQLAKVTATILAVPAQDGEPMSAHVTLEFEDGDVLDETFTGTLVSQPGICISDEE